MLPANLTHAFFNMETFDETDLGLLGPDGGWVFGRHDEFYGAQLFNSLLYGRADFVMGLVVSTNP